MSDLKTCRVCNELKPRGEYYPRHEMPDGLRSECKECTKARSAKSQRARKKERRTYMQDYGVKNRKKLNKQARERARKNKRYLYFREYRQENLEQVRANEERYRRRNRHKEAARRHKRRVMPIDDTAVEYIAILQKDVCSYCGNSGGTIDHIVAITEGGTNDWDNLTAACLSCNSSKKTESLVWFLHRRYQEELPHQ